MIGLKQLISMMWHGTPPASTTAAKPAAELAAERVTTFAGNLRKQPFSTAPYTPDDADTITDADLLAHYTPVQQLSRLSPDTLKPLETFDEIRKADAMLVAARRTKRKAPKVLYANPMQSLDYRVYESLAKRTIIGPILDALVKFIVGGGFKPELELINPDSDKVKNDTDITDNQEIIDRMLAIDNQVSAPSADGSSVDANFQHKVSALIMSCLMYNRGALIFEYGEPVMIGDQKYPEIPNNLIFAHARDLGQIEMDSDSHRMINVAWARDSFQPIETKDMIYLWNPLSSSKVYNSWHYGMSLVAPMISAAKIINTLLSEDFPAMAQTTWAGLHYIVAKNEGSTTEDKVAEFENIVNNIQPGRPGILIKDPEDVDVHNANFSPEVDKFQALMESMIKLCISMAGLPQVGFYDESASNRDTMAGKVQLTLQTNIEPMRKWIGDFIAAQWYDRWFRLIYKDDQEKLEKFRISVSWADLHISEWYDNIEAILSLDERKPLTDSAFGERIHWDNYPLAIDHEKAEEMEEQEKKMMQEAQNMGMGMQDMSGGKTPFAKKPNPALGGRSPANPGGKRAGPTKTGIGTGQRATKSFGKQRQGKV